MVDAGISGQAAIGGFELAQGSKPRMLGLSIFGDRSGAGAIYVDGTGAVIAQDGGATATVVFGAGSVTLGATTGGVAACSWVLGDGTSDGSDDLDIFSAHGTFAAKPAGPYVKAGTGAVPGTLNVTSINGGTVSFIISCPDEQNDDLVDDDGYYIQLFAYARGGV